MFVSRKVAYCRFTAVCRVQTRFSPTKFLQLSLDQFTVQSMLFNIYCDTLDFYVVSLPPDFHWLKRYK